MTFLYGALFFAIGSIWTRGILKRIKRERGSFVFLALWDISRSHVPEIVWAVAATLIGISTMILGLFKP